MATSFYGGMPGTSFIIKSKFASIQAMNDAFDSNDAYTDVWYDEYCIIDTVNKNDKDNGKIFRRGYNGAVYIGQIVGPASGTPWITAGTFEDVANNSGTEENDYRLYPIEIEEGETGNYKIHGDAGVQDSLNENNLHAIKATVANNALVPGKEIEDGQEVYNDSIEWTWCNVRKYGTGENEPDSYFHIGFTFPYLVNDFSVATTDPYSSNNVNIQRIDNFAHPFYNHWRLNIPRGISGDSLQNIRVINLNSAPNITYIDTTASVPPTFSSTIESDGTTKLTVNSAVKDGSNLQDQRFLVCQYKAYENTIIFNGSSIESSARPHTFDIYLGEFDWPVKTEIIPENGKIKTTFASEKESITTGGIVKWLKSVSMSEDGYLIRNYNFGNSENSKGDSPKPAPIKFIKEITQADNGIITITYNTKEENGIDYDKYASDPVKWITNIGYNNNIGSPDYGKLTITYNTYTLNENDEKIYDTNIFQTRSIKNMSFTGRSKNSSSGTVQNTPAFLQSAVDKYIDVLDNNQYKTALNVQYSSGNSNTFNFNNNYIVDTFYSSDSYLYIMYSSPSARPNNGFTSQDIFDKEKILRQRNFNPNDSAAVEAFWLELGINNYGEGIFWYELGPLKNDKGLLIGPSYTFDKLFYGDENPPESPSIEQIKSALVRKTGTLINIANLEGKVVSVGGETDTKYLFNYGLDPNNANSLTWFYLGTTSETGKAELTVLEENSILPDNWFANYTDPSYIFNYKTYTFVDSPLPSWNITTTNA